MANELGADFVPTAGPALERKGDVASYLTALEPRSVFFVDEIHRLPRALEETFYPAMEDRKLPITVGQGAGAAVVIARPARVHADRRHHAHRPAHHAAARPLRRDATGSSSTSRPTSRASCCARPASSTWRSTPPAPRRSPRRSRGTPRVANRLLKRVRDFAEVRGSGHIDERVAREALDLLEVDAAGLDRLDREILRAICEKFGGGPGRASARWPSRWARSPTRSRTSTSPICSSRAS